MNIEAANLSPSLASAVQVVGVNQAPSGEIDNGVDFSNALVTQVGLLDLENTGNVLPQSLINQAGVQGISSVPAVAEMSVTAVDVQNIAALVGQALPPTSNITEDAGHQAALVAVTDTLKYIATGTTSGEKAAEVLRNFNNVIAMVVPVQKSIGPVMGAGIPEVQTQVAVVDQSIKELIGGTVPEQQNINAVVGAGIPEVQAQVAVVDQSIKEPINGKIPGQQNIKAVIEKDVQLLQGKDAVVDQSIKEFVKKTGPAQINLKYASDKADKKQHNGVDQTPVSEGLRGTMELLASIIMPSAVPVQQGRPANDFASVEGAKNESILSFLKPATGDIKLNQSAIVTETALQGGAVMGQSTQVKEGLNLKHFESAEQAEMAGPVARQGLSMDAEKVLPGGLSVVQFNRPVADNKVELPALTKPLSHPDWNKDLGERIVWMSSKAIPTAEIRLNPENLGPISVRVAVTDDHATVIFTAQHATTREAIEASIPKLREMMSAQQLNLVDVSVTQGASSDRERSQAQNFAQTAGGHGQDIDSEGNDEIEQEIESGRAIVSKGLLSIYA